MCLAIVMYMITGTVSFIVQFAIALSASFLNLLGKTILLICTSIYEVVHPDHPLQVTVQELPNNLTAINITTTPVSTELREFKDDYDTMARVSLETVTSAENLSIQARRAALRREHKSCKSLSTRFNSPRMIVHRPSRRSSK